jgi:hypothetical protein
MSLINLQVLGRARSRESGSRQFLEIPLVCAQKIFSCKMDRLPKKAISIIMICWAGSFPSNLIRPLIGLSGFDFIFQQTFFSSGGRGRRKWIRAI